MHTLQSGSLVVLLTMMMVLGSGVTDIDRLPEMKDVIR